MSEKIRILKSRWDEVPSGTMAYISQYDIGMHLMTCDSGVIIVLQGYPWRIDSVRNLRRWFFVWICDRRISVFNNWGCLEHHSRKRFNLFWYRKYRDGSENLSWVYRLHKAFGGNWELKTYRKSKTKLAFIWWRLFFAFEVRITKIKDRN